MRAVASQNESGRVAMALCWRDRVFRPTALLHVCGSSASLLPERSLLFAVKKVKNKNGSVERMREETDRSESLGSSRTATGNSVNAFDARPLCLVATR